MTVHFPANMMPETYGAVGDGVTDDAAFLNAMIADIAPGVVVWMTPGKVYAVATSVTINAKDPAGIGGAP